MRSAIYCYRSRIYVNVTSRMLFYPLFDSDALLTTWHEAMSEMKTLRQASLLQRYSGCFRVEEKSRSRRRQRKAAWTHITGLVAATECGDIEV